MINKKIAVITGGSSGIGKAISEALVEQNYAVINADIAPPDHKHPADHFRCDVTKGEDIHQLYLHVQTHYGVPDVLISNAGQGIHEKIAEGDPDKWAKVIDINLMGALRFIRGFLPDMLQRQSGTILFISSTAGKQTYEYGGIYAASKVALNTVAKTLLLEVAGALRICLVSPGVVDTPFFKNMIGSNHTVKDIGWGSVTPKQLAEIITVMLNLPPSVNLPEITITPTPQPL
jgi:NADP-dependent 3-hydroxy acid dehydrogenase YdfG